MTTATLPVQTERLVQLTDYLNDCERRGVNPALHAVDEFLGMTAQAAAIPPKGRPPARHGVATMQATAPPPPKMTDEQAGAEVNAAFRRQVEAEVELLRRAGIVRTFAEVEANLSRDLRGRLEVFAATGDPADLDRPAPLTVPWPHEKGRT